MFGFAWLALRQAQDAIKDGRLEEAARLLGEPTAQAQRGSGALLVQLARAFVERGERQLKRDDPEAAWRDLLQAEQLQTTERSTARLRAALLSDEKQRSFDPLLAQMRAALDGGRWSEVIERAEQVLAAAPHHAEALHARARAWQALQPETVATGPPVVQPQAEPAATSPRFFLWIDGVGGYLICPGHRLTFGQASQPGVDLPLVADVSRIHATLTRDAEGYLLETVRSVQVNSQSVTRALLRSNDRITLGASCQLLFRQPVPVSSSAVLEIVSGHRLPRSVEGVLLLAETLILGPGPQVHVTIPDLKQPVILYRHKDGIGLRHAGMLTVNGQQVTERCVLGTQAHVVGEEISFALEPAN